jgi:virginiamycin B lyase
MGEVWAAEQPLIRVANEVGWIDRDGKITRIHVPTPQAGPAGIVGGLDSATWFTEENVNKIGRVALGPGAVPVEYPLAGDVRPHGITLGPDGNLWFTSLGNGEIGRMSPCGEPTAFPVGIQSAQIVAGPDGNLWFAEEHDHAVGRITPDGIVTSFPVGSDGDTTTAIARGTNRDVWFAETTSDKVGRIEMCASD